jgi:DNA-binding response OmpR family regulator
VRRPTILVAEPEPSQALSIRKLVLETAKFNVLTAHSTTEALEIGREFPNIDAAVLVGGDDLECQEMARGIKSLTTRVPTIGIRCEGTDYSVPSFEPEELVRLLRELLGDPRQIDAA